MSIFHFTRPLTNELNERDLLCVFISFFLSKYLVCESSLSPFLCRLEDVANTAAAYRRRPCRPSRSCALSALKYFGGSTCDDSKRKSYQQASQSRRVDPLIHSASGCSLAPETPASNPSMASSVPRYAYIHCNLRIHHILYSLNLLIVAGSTSTGSSVAG